MLQQIPLGKTSLSVAPLGLGTVKFGRNQAVKYPQAFEIPDDASLLALLEQARALGINLLDTAPAYGESEARLGRLLRKHEDWVICSKVGERFVDGTSFYDFSPASIEASLHASLRRLQRDYLDIVLLHANNNDRAMLEEDRALETLLRCRERGLVRAVGVSGKTPAVSMAALAEADVMMLTLNPQQQDDLPVIEAAAQRGVGILIKKALGSGHLCAQYSVEELIAWLFRHPVDCWVCGTLNPEHLRRNASAVARALAETAEPLPEETAPCV